MAAVREQNVIVTSPGFADFNGKKILDVLSVL